MRDDHARAQHTHPELVLTEHLWRAHVPVGDGPGSEAALTPRGAWMPRPTPLPGPPPPPPRGAGGVGAGGGGGQSMLAASVADDLAAAAAAAAAAPPAAPPDPPDWRCEPGSNSDMLRVCGHMSEVRTREGRTHARPHFAHFSLRASILTRARTRIVPTSFAPLISRVRPSRAVVLHADDAAPAAGRQARHLRLPRRGGGGVRPRGVWRAVARGRCGRGCVRRSCSSSRRGGGLLRAGARGAAADAGQIRGGASHIPLARALALTHGCTHLCPSFAF
jgi:hypothetical protein